MCSLIELEKCKGTVLFQVGTNLDSEVIKCRRDCEGTVKLSRRSSLSMVHSCPTDWLHAGSINIQETLEIPFFALPLLPLGLNMEFNIYVGRKRKELTSFISEANSEPCRARNSGTLDLNMIRFQASISKSGRPCRNQNPADLSKAACCGLRVGSCERCVVAVRRQWECNPMMGTGSQKADGLGT